MRYYQRNTYFPLTLTLLTLGLILFMFYAFTYKTEPAAYSIVTEVTEPVDAEAYRTDLAYAVVTFEDEYARASDDLSRLVAAENAVSTLLDMRVPTEYKDLHLELAITLNQLQAALRSTDRNADESLAALEQLKTLYPWLNE
ncbi:hypothetical protein CO174_02950 [Candidatus Uhrbacteria bacterium CG_4_9_14_3_um_filter_50_9]|uniref:Uncharacterized protein n=1 Tax=Candidatus Uhrbacteria bacterium CG_4_9_14_3_um_filter_50_9 TaxID=1975035 RepID=A0A2M7XCD0_9BACT|nr:MAG: hypothetical protein CO174_02950 [Candidatus Uhrbacteria bacterium CG_4_9_14_3_um_filter_50_9]